MNQKLSCLVVDDDPIICDMISHFVSKIDALNSVIATHNGVDAINLITNQSFDVVFLDYDLPGMNGEDILQCLPKGVKVIMITSNAQFAPESYSYEVVDFIVKPIEFSRFFKAVQKLLPTEETPTKSTTEEAIFVKDGNSFVRIEPSKLLYLKSDSNYVQFVTENKKILGLANLKDLEKKLPNQFLRVHRSYIVNLSKVDRIDHQDIEIGDTLIPISNSYKATVLSKLKTIS